MLLCGWLNNRSGNVAITAALSLPMVVGGAGFGVEVGYDYYEQVKVQQAADAAAFSGAVELRRGSVDDAVQAAASTAATQNGETSATDTLTVLTPSSGAPANSVQASIARTEPRFFSGMFVRAPMIVAAKATAEFASTSSACVLALDPSASQAINFSGNTTSTFTDCVVMSDSISSSSINVQGSAQMTAPCAYAVGHVTLTSGAHLGCGSAQTGMGPVGDPFASFPMPPDTGPCQNFNGSGNWQPGHYCGNGVSIKGKTHMQGGGVYVIDGGLSANANADVDIHGSGGVTLVFYGGSISLNCSSVWNISAPTSGPYAGMLMVGARGSSAPSSVTINGDSSSSMTGNMYFANTPVSYLGNFTGTNGCMHIVADTVQWTGNTTVSVNCSSYGMSTIPVGNVVLVG
jgi:Flp pilus assembly protein TadG